MAVDTKTRVNGSIYKKHVLMAVDTKKHVLMTVDTKNTC